ncbi:MAG: myo-inosose-2 dehydratase [Proteobacteria bacterium]|jgi:inosose dehydratase|nr:myo-inosose-2 dehydratase [Pseudomonadota bacterium]MDA0994703.1 myo-inosose-2 dehydratase [Pseudomonadota bacterium]
MNVTIGINPITWSNDDMQNVGADISFETCLREASAAGYDGVELGHKFPRDPNILRPKLEKYSLSLVSGWYSGQLLRRDSNEEIAAMQNHMKLLKAMGSDVLIFAEVSGCIHSDAGIRLSQRPRIPADQWPNFCRRLDEVAKACSAEGLKLSFHHHMGTVIQSREDIEIMMQSTSTDMHLLLDSGHAYFAGADPVELATQYADRIAHVHCKDIRENVLRRMRNRDSSFLDAVLAGVFTVPGDGCINYDGIFDALRKQDYSGWVVVEAEQDPSVAPPNQFAKLGFDNLKRLTAS